MPSNSTLRKMVKIFETNEVFKSKLVRIDRTNVETGAVLSTTFVRRVLVFHEFHEVEITFTDDETTKGGKIFANTQFKKFIIENFMDLSEEDRETIITAFPRSGIMESAAKLVLS